MKGSKLVLVCLLLMALALVASVIIASARPANPGFIVYTQRDGSKITLSMMGTDEYIKIGHTVDGYTLIPDDNGTYYYATLDKKGNLVRTNVKANDMWKRGKAEKAFTAQLAKGLDYTAEQKKAKTPTNQTFGYYWGINTTVGTVRLLCIRVYFKNYNWTLNPTTLYNSLMQHGYQSPIPGQTGSFHEYMESQSGGLMNVQFDMVGPYKLKNNWAWYGQNGSNGDKYQGNLYNEAITLMDPTVNFALYDNDNNGSVDPPVLIRAGYDECEGADSNWCYVSNTSLGVSYPWGFDPRPVDGKTAYGFTQWSEYRGTGGGTEISSIGNSTHELGHAMGAPDYHSQCWTIMHMGSWAGGDGDNPSGFGPHEKIVWGWTTPTVLTSPATNLTIANRYNNPVASPYKIVNATSGQYFLLQNVKQTGWDAFCLNSGMLVYHVGSQNSFSLLYADANNSCTTQTADCYPGSSSYTSLTDTSTPANMKDGFGNNTGKPITNITYDANNVVHFDFMQ